MPTIRVDEQVYAWLQEQARPFEDTPNSVLRRVANLDEITASSTRGEKSVNASSKGTPPAGTERLSGRLLNEKWGVGAKHALYHREGCWFNNLERFPGALFDPRGYVLFETERAYRASSRLKIAQETNVPGGISNVPGYVRMAK